jgi:hypothetical protein
MTRTAIGHMISALAALALVSAFAAAPASAQGTMTHELGHYLGLDHTLTNKKTGVKVKTPKGLATQKGSQAPAEVDSIDMYYSSEGSWGLTTKKPAPHSGDLLDKPTFGEKF